MSFNSRKLLFGSSNLNDPYWNNVSLLLHGDGIGATPNGQQNNSFLDSSTNNFSITRTGVPTQGSFSPYALNGVAYSPSIHGGSSYFSSGNLDKLTLPSTAVGSALDYGTGNFTIECWYNFIQVGPNGLGFIISQTVSGNNNLLFAVGSNRDVGIWLGNSNLGTSAVNSIPLNTWSHIALVRSGTSVQVYVNGVSVLTRTSSASLGGGMLPCINGYGHASGYGNICYISNMRIVKGLAVYTSNFTPPTSPVTLTSNGGATPSTSPTSGQVSLLCNFTNGGIFDNTKKNVLTTAGNARVSTSVVKYGTGAMYFDGTGDYLKIPSSSNFAFGTGDFTVEFWMYPTANVPWLSLCGTQPAAITDSRGWNITVTNGSPEIAFWSDAKFIPAAITLNQWNYVSVTRSGTTLRMFINGTIANSTTNNQNFTFDQLGVGCTGVGIQPFNGYIDDLRITKGVARYTSAFTPPTRAFPNK